MNILLVTETYLPYISGVSSSTDSIARYLVSRGHTVTLLHPEPVLPHHVATPPGLTLRYVPAIPDLVYAGKSMSIFPRALPILHEILHGQSFDISHIQEPGSLGLSALFMAKRYHIPTIGALHFLPEQVSRMLPGKTESLLRPLITLFIRHMYNQYTAVMVPTQTYQSFLESIGITSPVTVISNGVDTRRFQPAPLNYSLRRSLFIPDEAIVFFFLGRIDRDKNVETLIRALPFTDPTVRLLIVGEGKVKASLLKLADSLQMEDRIMWVPYISDEQMPDYYHVADAFCIMSPYEVQSIVTLQAVASGLPVIAARAGALPELVHDGENGFIVDVYDYRGLANRMNTLARDKKLRKKFEAASRAISLPHQKEMILKRLEKLYQEIMDAESSSA